MKKTIYILSMLFIMQANLFAGQMVRSNVPTDGVSVEIRADKQEIVIGDPVQIDVIVKYDRKYDLLWDGFAEKIGEMVIINADKPDSNIKMDHIELHHTYLVSAYDSGTFTIAPAPILYRDEMGMVDSIFSNGMKLRVETVAVDTAQAIRPIKANLGAPMSFMEILPYIILGLLGVILVSMLIVWLYVIGTKKEAEPVRRKISLPPHEHALKRLRILENKKLWQNSRTKEYYFEISEIVREYIELRFETLALESTTSEVIEDLKPLVSEPMVLNKLKELLELADLVKFAKWQALPDENMKVMDVAKEFVHATKLHEEIQKEAEKKAVTV